MKDVKFTQAYIQKWTEQNRIDFEVKYGKHEDDNCGLNENLSTLEFDIQMITEHDPKGKFGIGFLVVDNRDGNGPKLGIFDDDRKIIGIFHDNKHAIEILNKIMDTRKSRHVFNYLYPHEVRKWRVDPEREMGTKRVKCMNYDEKALKGFQFSKDVLIKGEIPEDRVEKNWRDENKQKNKESCYHCKAIEELTTVFFPDERMINDKEDEVIVRLYCEQCAKDLIEKKFDPQTDPSYSIALQ